MQAATNGVGFHPDADQIIGVEHFEGLLFSE
jgi:hypothetical protein